jgi:phosphatidate phosphatase PAH1
MQIVPFAADGMPDKADKLANPPGDPSVNQMMITAVTTPVAAESVRNPMAMAEATPAASLYYTDFQGGLKTGQRESQARDNEQSWLLQSRDEQLLSMGKRIAELQKQQQALLSQIQGVTGNVTGNKEEKTLLEQRLNQLGVSENSLQLDYDDFAVTSLRMALKLDDKFLE